MSVSYAPFALPSLYTPQKARHYQPKTPSPLRTSRNANIMPPPPTPAPASKLPAETKFSPLSVVTNADDLENLNSPVPNKTETFTFATTTSSTTQPQFAFEARARSQSPQATLAKTNRDAKERRKTLFLERVRKSRDDVRFDGRTDQALRIEFVQQRREWEERLRRKAPVENELDADAMVDDEDVALEMSPTEDEELEELLSYLDGGDGAKAKEDRSMLDPVSRYTSDPQRTGAGSDTISDDDDYDQLFQEVLAHGENEGIFAGSQELGHQQLADQDSSMDLS